MANSISTRIKAFRIKKKWSQSDLARRINTSRPTVTQWESGDTKNIKNDNLVSLAHAFGITVDELLTGKSALGVSEPPGEYKLMPDITLLQDCIQTVEEIVGDQAEKLSPENKAKVIIVAYKSADTENKIDLRKISRHIVEIIGRK